MSSATEEDLNDHSSSLKLVPRCFHRCNTSILETLISDMLCKIAEHNDRIPVTPSSLTRFHSRACPSISINAYIHRIVHFASVEKSCLLILLVSLDRICQRHPSFLISSLTLHRFIIACVTVVAKALCDSYCTNAHYARVGGISTQELNTLELEFLFLVDWDLFCDRETLQRYYVHLVQQSGQYQITNETPCNIHEEFTDRNLDTFDDSKYVVN